MQPQAQNIFHNCPVCGSEKLKDLSAFRHVYLCRCKACGFVFSRRKPSLVELEDYYTQYTYGDHYYSSPLTLKRYKELLQSFEPYRKNNRLLDVGCGNGDFLLVAKEMGWDCVGTEFSPKAVEICKSKGLNVLQGDLKTLTDGLGAFDIITSFEVIEHINTPANEVGLMHKHLRPGGLLYITTPNFNSLMRILLGQRYDAIVYPEHLSYFTPSSLNYLMNMQGFKKISIKTTGFSFSRFRNALFSRKENPFTQDSADEQFRKMMDSGPALRAFKIFWDGLFNMTGRGLSMKGRFEKRS